MTKKINILLILLLITLFSCKKEQKSLPTELPPLTTEGKNTFGCLIENEIYVPEIRRTALTTPIYINEFPKYPNYCFTVTTTRLVNNNDNVMDAEVGFKISIVKDTGEYNIIYSTIKYNNKYYQSDSLNNGKLKIIKLDTINKIISGTFYIKALSEDSNIINITNGRFDLKK